METKRALKNAGMFWAVGLEILILGRAYMEFWPGMKQMDVLYIITLPMALSGYTPFAAVFPAVPFSLSFAEEYNSGYWRFALIRQTKRSYITNKIKAVILSGGMQMGVSFAIIFGVAVIIGTPVKIHDISGFYENSIWEDIMEMGGGYLVLLLKTALAFLFGAVWSMVCCLLSVVSLNRYVAFIGTFISYQALWQILEGSIWNPVYLLRGDSKIYRFLWQPFALQLGVLIVLVISSVILMRRRMLDV